MTKQQSDKLRSKVLYEHEALYVICTTNYGNFLKDVPIEAKPRFVCKSGLPYPQPKWIACDYYITDKDGDSYKVAKDRYGKLEKGFEWVKLNE